jgi:hypothetical protein
VAEGEHVIGHIGKFCRVIKTGSRDFTGSICEIQARGFGNKLRLTDNHRVLIKRWGQNHWVESGKIHGDDFLSFTLPTRTLSRYEYDLAALEDFSNSHYWEIGEKYIQNKTGKKSKINRYINLVENFAWLLGLYAAEGSTCVDQVRFSLNIGEQNLVDKIKEKFVAVFGINHCTDYKKPSSNGRDIICGKKSVGKLFSTLVGNKASNKRVPKEILVHTSNRVMQAFIDGYMAGDGSYNKTKVCYEANTTSSALAYEMFILLSHLGYQANVRMCREAHQAKMPNGKISNCNPIYKFYYFDKEMPRKQKYAIKNCGTHLEAQIRAYKRYLWSGKVYNIQVEQDESYMTSAFHVKNCEYIHRDTLEIFPHIQTMPPEALKLHDTIKQLRAEGKPIPDAMLAAYRDMVKQVAEHMPVVYHYSWHNLEVKKQRGEFWNETVHGKEEATHNTTKNIEERIGEERELTLKVDFQHPLKKDGDG